MDADKDGLLSSSDLVAAFGAYGKNIGGGEAQAMLDEVDGPMNFTQMVTLFASKMAGGSDDDDVILASFEAFEIDGKIDADAFRHSLMTFGVKVNISWQVFSHQSIANRIIRKKPHVEEFPSDDPATWYCHPLLCGNSHSFCEKSSSPSSIRDSPLGSMKIY